MHHQRLSWCSMSPSRAYVPVSSSILDVVRRTGMIMRRFLAVMVLGMASALAGCASMEQGANAPAPGAVAAPPGPMAPAPTDPDPWPRQLQVSDAMLTVYQPQVESWQGNQLAFRAAVAAKAQGANTETFGVIWGSARTEVDRVARRVTLEDLRLTR